MNTCPRCGKDYSEYPAISKVDGKTEICPTCGTEEAQIKAGIVPPTENEIKFIEKLKGSVTSGGQKET
jgi:uncharacterized Zn finger protein (UPF0148 family)